MQARREDGVEKAGYSDQRRNRDRKTSVLELYVCFLFLFFLKELNVSIFNLN